ncbi:MAG: CHRD domain-containing protein [Phycisphaerales bacterium]|nr:CHRD domain-containing protein [Phycisphaerales bacterium]
MKNQLMAAGAFSLCAGVASANVVTFVFPIDVAQEVPAPTIPAGFDPSGTGIVSIDTVSNLLTWEIEYQGLTGPIVAPGAHFHGPADFGQTAGVELFLTMDLPQPASGTIIGSATINTQQRDDLLAGLWYVNLHTDLNQPGEIRGQVVPAPGALAALGLAGLVGLRRRR